MGIDTAWTTVVEPPYSESGYGVIIQLKPVVKIFVPTWFFLAMEERMKIHCTENKKRTSQAILESVMRDEILGLIEEEWGFLKESGNAH